MLASVSPHPRARLPPTFGDRSLIMDVKKKDRVLVARYDFVLRPI